MDYVWIIHGLCMDYLWIVYGFAVVFTMIPIVFYVVSGTIECRSYVFCNESGISERGCICYNYSYSFDNASCIIECKFCCFCADSGSFDCTFRCFLALPEILLAQIFKLQRKNRVSVDVCWLGNHVPCTQSMCDYVQRIVFHRIVVR